MPGYMKDALQKFRHPAPTRPQHLPHQLTTPNYGYTEPHLEHPTYNSPELNIDESKNFQLVLGMFFYHSQAFDPTNIFTLNTISAERSKITQDTAKKVVQLLNYEATHPEAITCYHTIGMTLHMHSDAYFL